MVGRSLACLLLVAACNQSGPTSVVDAGAVDATSSLADLTADGALASDATTGAPDLVWNPAHPNPPSGAMPCGDGVFSDADSKLVCQTPSLLLDHWGMQQQPFPRACDGATITGGSWQVWCTATEAYVFVRFTGLRASGTLVCQNTTALNLGALYESGSGGGDTGNNVRSGYGGVPDGTFDVNNTIDAYVWVTVAVAGKSANLWLTPSSYFTPCGSMNAGYRSVVGGAHPTWTP